MAALGSAESQLSDAATSIKIGPLVQKIWRNENEIC